MQLSYLIITYLKMPLNDFKQFLQRHGSIEGDLEVIVTALEIRTESLDEFIGEHPQAFELVAL